MAVGRHETVRRRLRQIVDALRIGAALSGYDPKTVSVSQPPIARSRILQPPAAFLSERRTTQREECETGEKNDVRDPALHAPTRVGIRHGRALLGTSGENSHQVV
jgi:hypothetical protein